MGRNAFPPEVSDQLGWYVYRLIDPRNGETFYVGKGRGNRVFDHVRDVVVLDDEDALDLKRQRIREIHASGLEVGHVIHRHGIDSENVAFQIEAALIDAYPGLTNVVTGHRSGDYGVRHSEQLIREYSAEPFRAEEPLILISIGRSFEEGELSIYDAVRGVWRIDNDRANEVRLVLAHRRGLVLQAFRPEGQWIPATKTNFPWIAEDIPGRWGFIGHPAEPEVRQSYEGKRVPDQYRKKGAANPVRFIDREEA